MSSIICFSCSIVIVDMLNTFMKKYIYSKAKVNNIIIEYYIQELSDNLMLLEMHKITVFPLVNMEMEAFEQILSLQKDGDGGICKNTSYWYSCM